ncbi:TerC family protein [Epilithonimonas hominis]|uniref:Tellurite resistance protein TerC n=2 Tax=Epilithonimonas hominis TaxID=420404 RepID=A0A1H6L1T8_9FLAO|nr:TerC family protein [Epilithonimonas hominis]SEH79305.1 tellurite resistance protein TerC [Epilithonimonas hominis]
MNNSIIDLHPGLIVGFAVVIIIMLLLDLGVFNKKSHEVSSKEALWWSIAWISLSMAFSGVVYWVYNQDSGGHQLAIEKFTQYQSAYWIEKALSVDNLFVFILVFSFFNVPKYLHHKVLFWGVLGALLFRAIFIFAGVWLLKYTYLPSFDIGGWHFGLDPHNESLTSSWVNKDFFRINIILSLFGLFLIYAGIKSWKEAAGDEEEEEQDFSNSVGAKFVRKLYKVSDNFDGAKFFTIQNGVKMATPLLTVIAVIEVTDLLFAVDSIPAIFAISKDPFILYTSNIFAILGLRSLYFLLANFIHMFSKLPYGLAFVLAFIGFKMLIAPVIHIPSPVSLGIVGGILILSVVLSIVFPETKEDLTAKLDDDLTGDGLND